MSRAGSLGCTKIQKTKETPPTRQQTNYRKSKIYSYRDVDPSNKALTTADRDYKTITKFYNETISNFTTWRIPTAITDL